MIEIDADGVEYPKFLNNSANTSVLFFARKIKGISMYVGIIPLTSRRDEFGRGLSVSEEVSLSAWNSNLFQKLQLLFFFNELADDSNISVLADRDDFIENFFTIRLFKKAL